MDVIKLKQIIIEVIITVVIGAKLQSLVSPHQNPDSLDLVVSHQFDLSCAALFELRLSFTGVVTIEFGTTWRDEDY